MFSANRGDTILPVKSDTGFGPVYWVASSSQSRSAYYVKLANYGPSEQAVTVTFSGASSSSSSSSPPANLTLLAGAQLASNYPGVVTVAPNTTAVAAGSSSGGYSFTIPPWGVAVLAAPQAAGGAQRAGAEQVQSSRAGALRLTLTAWWSLAGLVTCLALPAVVFYTAWFA